MDIIDAGRHVCFWGKRTWLFALRMSTYDPKRTSPVLRFDDRINHPPDSVSRCSELIAVAVCKWMVIQLFASPC